LLITAAYLRTIVNCTGNCHIKTALQTLILNAILNATCKFTRSLFIQLAHFPESLQGRRVHSSKRLGIIMEIAFLSPAPN